MKDSQHHHDIKSDMSFEDRLVKLLEHWIQHNIDHADTYNNWAQKAAAEGLTDVARIIESAAGQTTRINREFEKAVKGVRKGSPIKEKGVKSALDS